MCIIITDKHCARFPNVNEKTVFLNWYCSEITGRSNIHIYTTCTVVINMRIALAIKSIVSILYLFVYL